MQFVIFSQFLISSQSSIANPESHLSDHFKQFRSPPKKTNHFNLGEMAGDITGLEMKPPHQKAANSLPPTPGLERSLQNILQQFSLPSRLKRQN